MAPTTTNRKSNADDNEDNKKDPNEGGAKAQSPKPVRFRKKRYCYYPHCSKWIKRSGFCTKHLELVDELKIDTRLVDFAEAKTDRDLVIFSMLGCLEEFYPASTEDEVDREIQSFADLHARRMNDGDSNKRGPTEAEKTEKLDGDLSSSMFQNSSRAKNHRNPMNSISDNGEGVAGTPTGKRSGASPRKDKRKGKPSTSSQAKRRRPPLSVEQITDQLAYSWASLKLGTENGTSAFNAYLRQERLWEVDGLEEVPQLTAPQVLQLVRSMRPQTVPPHDHSELHEFIKQRRPEDDEDYEGISGYDGTQLNDEPAPLSETLSNVYHKMCQQDADDWSQFRQQTDYMPATECIETLQSMERDIYCLQEQEDHIMRTARSLGHLDSEMARRVATLLVPDRRPSELASFK